LAIDLAKSDSVSPARLAAFEILRRVEDGAFASILITSRQEVLNQPDRALLQELVLGVLRQQLLLDRLIEHFADRSVLQLDQPVKIALRMGLYQLKFLTRIPASAAVNESVNLMRTARVRSAGSFVNAVLRRATREPDYNPSEGISDPIDRLAIETSHPAWLLARWIKDFGFDFTSQLAAANNDTPPLAFRVVKNRADESEVLHRLRVSGASVTPSPIARNGWRLSGSASTLIEMARAGEVYVQDEASQLVGEVLNPRKGEMVLDLCSAPGSKTSQLADLAENRAVVIAADINEARLATVRQTAKLHKLTSIQTLVLDGLSSLPFTDQRFDAVLIDASCSGTGTFRRNPEIRWRISAADLEELSARQVKLITNAAMSVKPDGRLIYSTCSFEKDENEEVVEAFLARHNEFERVRPAVSQELITESNTVRTWPHREGTDGFFIAALKRNQR
jgi:16S rRNA (cytosine967-C5)-methyltransferase